MKILCILHSKISFSMCISGILQQQLSFMTTLLKSSPRPRDKGIKKRQAETQDETEDIRVYLKQGLNFMKPTRSSTCKMGLFSNAPLSVFPFNIIQKYRLSCRLTSGNTLRICLSHWTMSDATKRSANPSPWHLQCLHECNPQPAKAPAAFTTSQQAGRPV